MRDVQAMCRLNDWAKLTALFRCEREYHESRVESECSDLPRGCGLSLHADRDGDSGLLRKLLRLPQSGGLDGGLELGKSCSEYRDLPVRRAKWKG